MKKLNKITISKILAVSAPQSIHPLGRIVVSLLGASNSGRSVQGKLLSAEYGWSYLSTKDLFRYETQNFTELGNQILSHYQNSNHYVPDEITIGMVSKKLLSYNYNEGVVLDGFPRTKVQSQALCNLFLRPYDLHLPILLSSDAKKCSDYLALRLICRKCGARFSKYDKLRVLNHCQDCNAPLQVVEEQATKAEMINKLELHNVNLPHVVDVIKKRDSIYIVHIDGDNSSKKIFETIGTLIQKELQDFDIKKNQKFGVKKWKSGD